MRNSIALLYAKHMVLSEGFLIFPFGMGQDDVDKLFCGSRPSTQDTRTRLTQWTKRLQS